MELKKQLEVKNNLMKIIDKQIELQKRDISFIDKEVEGIYDFYIRRYNKLTLSKLNLSNNKIDKFLNNEITILKLTGQIPTLLGWEKERVFGKPKKDKAVRNWKAKLGI